MYSFGASMRHSKSVPQITWRHNSPFKKPSFARGFAETPATPKATENVERKMETKVVPPITPAQTKTEKSERSYRELKNAIGNSPPRFMNLWYLLGASGLIAAILYYLNDSDSQERKVHRVTRMLSNPDLETRRLGLQALDSCLFEEKRLLSTTTDIPQPKSYLVKQGVVEALYEAFHDGDDGIKERAVVWLIRLSSEDEGRKRIIKMGLQPFLSSAQNSEAKSSVWLVCSALFLELTKYKETVGLVASPSVVSSIQQLYLSSNPIAKLAAANLYSVLLKNDVGKEAVASHLSTTQQNQLTTYTSPSAIAALKAAVQAVIPREPGPRNPALGFENSGLVLWRAVAFGAVGSIWGRIRWWLYARRHKLTSKEVRKFVRKKNRTGRYVFSLMAMDLVAQALMMWPKEGLIVPFVDSPIKFPELGLPMSTVIPIGEAGLITLLSLWSIRTQRYVVFPMLIAAIESHWDYVSKLIKPYTSALGIDAIFGRAWNVVKDEVKSLKPKDTK